MADYHYLTVTEYRRLKTQLTRAINAKDPAKVLTACNTFLAVCSDRPWPDDWARWLRAADDATLVTWRTGQEAIRRALETCSERLGR